MAQLNERRPPTSSKASYRRSAKRRTPPSIWYCWRRSVWFNVRTACSIRSIRPTNAPTASSPVSVADVSEPLLPPANTTKAIASSDSPIAINPISVSVWSDSVIASVPGGPMWRETARQRRSPRGTEVYGRSVDVARTEDEQRHDEQSEDVDRQDDRGFRQTDQDRRPTGRLRDGEGVAALVVDRLLSDDHLGRADQQTVLDRGPEPGDHAFEKDQISEEHTDSRHGGSPDHRDGERDQTDPGRDRGDPDDGLESIPEPRGGSANARSSQ